jgi:hypothetical protein
MKFNGYSRRRRRTPTARGRLQRRLSATLWALASGLRARRRASCFTPTPTPVMDEMTQTITIKPYRASKLNPARLGSPVRSRLPPPLLFYAGDGRPVGKSGSPDCYDTTTAVAIPL